MGGAYLRLLDAIEGDLLLETRLHTPEAGRLLEPDNTGTAITFGTGQQASQVFVMTDGHVLRNIDRVTGEVKWGWSAPDQTSVSISSLLLQWDLDFGNNYCSRAIADTLTIRSLVVYSKILATPSAIYILGLSKSFASYTLHITSLSPVTGELISDVNVPSSVTSGFSDVLVLRDLRTSEAEPQVVWLEGKVIKSFALTPSLKAKTSAIKEAVYRSVEDVGVSEYGQFVAVKEDGSAWVIRLSSEGLKVIWEYADSVRTMLSRLPDCHIDFLLAGHVASALRSNLCWRSRRRWIPVYCPGFLVTFI